MFCLDTIIEHAVNNIKEDCIIFVSSKIGITHLGITILLLVL